MALFGKKPSKDPEPKEPEVVNIPESKLFPFYMVGTIDNTPVSCPFLVAHDISNYMESLQWSMTKMHANIDIKVYQNGAVIGEVKTPPELLLTH